MKRQLIEHLTFLHPGAPDDRWFTHEVGPKWANKEIQHYVNDRDHSFVRDGALIIRATKNPITGIYESARLTTFGKKQFLYGRFEITAQLPKGIGTWPALWFLSDRCKLSQGRWPDCGEIDLMEHVGKNENDIFFTLHCQKYNHKINTQLTANFLIPNATENFHTYFMEWEKESISFGVNDHIYVTYTKKENDDHAGWPFQEPYHLIVNLAIGGWGGPIIEDKKLPFELKIKEIRYYR